MRPGYCKGKAHRREHLGYAGRRVLVSRKWSGKTLADHRAFTMWQYVQTDLEADRQVANTLAALSIGGSLASVQVPDETGNENQDDQDQADDTDENKLDSGGTDAAA